MTRPTPETDPAPTSSEVRELVAGVGKLATEVKGLAEQQGLDRQAAKDGVGGVARQARKDRRKTWIIAASVALDLVLSVIVLRQQFVQNCINGQDDARNRTSVAFFVAERAKLVGQTQGLADLARRESTKGFTEFRAATANDLAFINTRLRDLGVKVGPHGNPILNAHGDPVIVNPPEGC